MIGIGPVMELTYLRSLETVYFTVVHNKKEIPKKSKETKKADGWKFWFGFFFVFFRAIFDIKEFNEFVGLYWYISFHKRHEKYCIRKPQVVSLARLLAFARKNVNLFYDNSYALFSNNPEHFSDGSRIFNLDKTGVHMVQNPTKGLTV